MEHKGTQSATITRVTGPLVRANGMAGAKMFEVVRVGDEKLMGEIIELDGDTAAIQVYEETGGVGPGEPVERTGRTMSVELGPGLLESFYDGIQRPLKVIEEKSGSPFIARGIEATGLDHENSEEDATRYMKAEQEILQRAGYTSSNL